jgi:hypothetical protein
MSAKVAHVKHKPEANKVKTTTQIPAQAGTFIAVFWSNGSTELVPVIGWHFVEMSPIRGLEDVHVMVDPITVDGSNTLNEYDAESSETAILHPCGRVQSPLIQDFNDLEDWYGWVESTRGWSRKRTH